MWVNLDAQIIANDGSQNGHHKNCLDCVRPGIPEGSKATNYPTSGIPEGLRTHFARYSTCT